MPDSRAAREGSRRAGVQHRGKFSIGFRACLNPSSQALATLTNTSLAADRWPSAARASSLRF